MPKVQPINPSILSQGHYPDPRNIPSYTYQKTLVDEMRAGQLSAEDVREIYFQMVLARKFDEMLLETKRRTFTVKLSTSTTVRSTFQLVKKPWRLDKLTI
ncbi:hypothetical protein [Mycoplasma sp. ATU-Cv-508]|uniref:hypothetical protein n=1 Tax=Mycoplasma sp. ATU-Cv-508 TaxID=2048001 RepID=UPI000FDD07E9